MYFKMNEEELRVICKVSIENLEKWARLIIDKEMKAQYGDNYFYVRENDIPIIKKEIIEKAQNMINKNSNRFPRIIDTLFLDEIIYFLCKESLYRKCFKKCLDIIYPDGRMEAKTFLTRIIPIRNKLSHSNPISIREAERVICYSNDFVEGVKEYMKQEGKQNEYNVPNIIKINDSLGHEYFLNKNVSFEMIEIKDDNNLHEFEIGDKYSVWLTLDPSFEREKYIFKWSAENGARLPVNNLDRIDLVLNENLVGERQAIYCTLRSNNIWHRYRGYDQQFAIVFNVLPPRN